MFTRPERFCRSRARVSELTEDPAHVEKRGELPGLLDVQVVCEMTAASPRGRHRQAGATHNTHVCRKHDLNQVTIVRW